MPPKKSNNGEWLYEGQEITSISQFPTGTMGFIYRIELMDGSGRYYIGRKTALSTSKRKLTPKEKLLPENARKTYSYSIKEYTWRSYCGSNTTLKELVKNGTPISKHILYFCSTKAELTYRESAEILCSSCLLDPLSFNDWMSCKVYKRFLTNIK